MKVGIIAFNNIQFCPYIKPYTIHCQKKKVDYNVIFFDRLLQGSMNKNEIAISWNSRRSKLINFIQFARKVSKLISNNTYDFLIVLTTIPAVLLSTVLVSQYKNRYIIDIRDYTYEGNKFFWLRECKVIHYAAARVISSPGFASFLPHEKYVLCHNNTHYKSGISNRHEFSQTAKRIIIGYVGSLSYASMCKIVIDLVKNDERFCFHFYGKETVGNLIQNMISMVDCDRIVYFGEYDPNEKGKIISKIDILFNVYGNDRQLVKYALSNKLYDGIYFKKPILTSPNTDMSRYAGILSFDIDSNTKDLNQLYRWYKSLKSGPIEKYTGEFINKVENEQDVFFNMLDSMI